jgi:hypothetical protein
MDTLAMGSWVGIALLAVLVLLAAAMMINLSAAIVNPSVVAAIKPSVVAATPGRHSRQGLRLTSRLYVLATTH